MYFAPTRSQRKPYAGKHQEPNVSGVNASAASDGAASPMVFHPGVTRIVGIHAPSIKGGSYGTVVCEG